MNNKYVLTFLILLYLLISTLNNSIFACQCGFYDPPNLEEHIKEIDLIVVGKVIKLQKINFDKGKEVEYIAPIGDTLTYQNFSNYKATIVVSEKFKGKFRNKTIMVYTGDGRGDCGFDFTVGQIYIIYGHKQSFNIHWYQRIRRNTFSTTICTLTNYYDTKERNDLVKYFKSNEPIHYFKL
jgi:hypothetical protein